MEEKPIKTEVKQRLLNLQSWLKKQDIDGALIVQKTDLYYFCGTDQDAHLWVPQEGNPLLMVRKSIHRARKDSPLQDIIPLNSLSILPDYVKPGKRLGLELDVLPARNYLLYQRLFEGVELVDVSHIIRSIRMIKSPYEVEMVRKAAQLADELHKSIPEFLTRASTEIELSAMADEFYRRRGHPGITRMRGFNMESVYGHIIAGGAGTLPGNSPGPTAGTGPGPFLSQGSGNNPINPNEPVMVDYSSNFNGYISDQARIYSIGRIAPELERAHDVMLMIQDRIIKEARPGKRAEELYRIAVEIAERHGLRDVFMGHPEPVPFVAHGVGLELDEWPLIGRDSPHIMEEGMVLALEPKCIFPGKGVVGVENTFLVAETGLEKINSYPDNIIVC